MPCFLRWQAKDPSLPAAVWPEPSKCQWSVYDQLPTTCNSSEKEGTGKEMPGAMFTLVWNNSMTECCFHRKTKTEQNKKKKHMAQEKKSENLKGTKLWGHAGDINFNKEHLVCCLKLCSFLFEIC